MNFEFCNETQASDQFLKSQNLKTKSSDMPFCILLKLKKNTFFIDGSKQFHV